MLESHATADPAAEVTSPARKRIYVDDAQIAAAKLQMTLDRKFGRKTPDIIKKIAAVGDDWRW